MMSIQYVLQNLQFIVFQADVHFVQVFIYVKKKQKEKIGYQSFINVKIGLQNVVYPCTKNSIKIMYFLDMVDRYHRSRVLELASLSLYQISVKEHQTRCEKKSS